MPQAAPSPGTDCRKLRKALAEVIDRVNALENVPIQVLMGDGTTGTGKMVAQGSKFTIVLEIPATSA